MRQPAKHFYDFGPFRLDLDQRELLRDGERVPVPPKVFKTLRALVENHGRILEKDELMKAVWPDTFVEEGNLTLYIFLLRKLLGKGLNGRPAIETIPRRGYRFAAPVEERLAEAETDHSARTSPAATAEAAENARASGGEKAPEVGLGGVPARAAAAQPQLRVVAEPYPRRESRMKLLGLAAGLIALTALLVWVVMRPAPAPRMVSAVKLTDFGRAETFDGLATDGVRLYFIERKGGHRGLMQVSVNGGEPAPIPTPFPSVTLFGISPDHSELLVGSMTTNEQEVPLWSLTLPVASPRRLGSIIAHDAAWSPDGKKLFYAQESDVFLANANGSEPRKLAGVNGSGWWPCWSPDGHSIRFTLKENLPAAGFTLWEISADGTGLRPLLPGWRPVEHAWGLGESAGEWAPDGRFFLFRSRHGTEGIWAIRESVSFFGFARHAPAEIYWSSALDFYTLLPSLDGRRLFFIGQLEQRELARYDSKSSQFAPYLPQISADFAGPLAFSKDGRWAVYASNSRLYRSKLDGSERVELSSAPTGSGYFSVNFSPDGRRVAFEVVRSASVSKIFVTASGSGDAEQLISAPYRDTEPQWSPDGNTILFTRCIPKPGHGDVQCYACLLDLKTRQVSKLPGSEGGQAFRWSPDGRYVSADRIPGVSLLDLHSGHWRQLGKFTTFFHPSWSKDGLYLYGQQVAGQVRQPIVRIRVSDGNIERVTSPDLSLPADVAGYGFIGLAPDGSPIVVLLRKNSDIYALDLDLP